MEDFVQKSDWKTIITAFKNVYSFILPQRTSTTRIFIDEMRPWSAKDNENYGHLCVAVALKLQVMGYLTIEKIKQRANVRH